MNTPIINAIVTAPTARLYESPDSTTLSDELLSGSGAQVVSAEGKWLRLLSAHRYCGWVARADLELRPDRVTGWLSRDKLMIATHFADVMQEPTVRSHILLTLPLGSLVASTGEPLDNWLPVMTADGSKGYINVPQLSHYPLGQGLPAEQLRQSVVRLATSYLGCGYRFGGKTPAGIDCSGLVSQVYLCHGIVLWRDAALREGFAAQSIEREQLLPADLLYWKGHVGLYLGGNRFLHANATDGAVTTASLDPAAPDCRHDLCDSVLCYGSVF